MKENSIGDTEFCQRLAERLNIPFTQSRQFVKAFEAELFAAFEKNERVVLWDFGAFNIRTHPARKNLYFKNAPNVCSVESKVVTFSLSQGRRDKLNERSVKDYNAIRRQKQKAATIN